MKLTYICSSGHSGSTLLDLLLGSHPSCCSLGEVSDLQRWLRENLTCTCGKQILGCAFWTSVCSELRSGQDAEEMAQCKGMRTRRVIPQQGGLKGRLSYNLLGVLLALGNQDLVRLGASVFQLHRTTREVVETNWRLFEAIQAKTGCEVIVDSSKAPMRMKLLYLQAPRAVKVIHLVRDGRGVTASYMRKGWKAEDAIKGWVRANRNIRRMLITVARNDKHLVRYEDLCENPRLELGRICAFVGLTFTEQMLGFRNVVHHNISGNRMRFGKSECIRSDEGWRKVLDAETLKLFDDVGAELNRRLGYDD